MVRVNLGSGQRPFGTPEAHWVNVDKQAVWKPDILWDAGNPLDPCPFEKESVDMIVLHHVLEHFGCGEGNGLIAQCHKILKKGGSLIVTVPDLRALARRWLFGSLDTQIYLTNLYGAYMSDEADRHKWGFDTRSLTDTLKAAAKWSEVKEFDNREIPGASIAKDFWILGKEAIK